MPAIRYALILALVPLILTGPPVMAQISGGEVDVPLGPTNESSIAVNPLDPNNIAVTFNGVSSRNSDYGAQIRVSTNGGTTFSAPTSSPLPIRYHPVADSVVAFDSQGRLYWTYLGRRTRNPGFNKSDIFVSQVNPTTGAVLPGYPVNVTDGAGFPATEGNKNHKQWIAADHFIGSPFQDRIYMVWSVQQPPCEQGCGSVLTSFSADQGMTWSSALTIFTTLEGFPFTHNAVSANGDVYVAYNDRPRESSGESGQVMVHRSTDGGVSFPQKSMAYAPGAADVTSNRQNRPRRLYKNASLIGGSRQPWVLPDPINTNNVYVVSADDPTNLDHGVGFDNLAVYIVRSLNQGLSWSAPVQIDAGPGTSHQIHPTAAIDDLTGCVAVTWYDSRAERTNADGNFLLDVVLTSSGDGGLTFGPEFSINDVPFDPDLGAPVGNPGPPPSFFIGEYNGVAVDDRVARMSWTANNTGRAQQILFDRAAICDGLAFIDIKPDSDPNSINPSLEGDLPVALLGWDGFDVNEVDVTTLAFGPGGAPFDHSRGPHFEDLNGDGFTDLMAHYRIEEAGIAFGDMEACLRGERLDGSPFGGCDSVRTVPDMDGDKLLDVQEATIGTDALNPDTDGDGFEDGHEVFVMGTDPLNARDPKPVRERRGGRKRSR
jgi:hypothetical protein